MPWWSWLILGFALLAGEMLATGGFYLLFAGIGALIRLGQAEAADPFTGAEFG